MKRSLSFIVAFLAFGVLNAQETLQFRTNHPQGISIESSTASGLSLHYSIQELGLANIDNGEVKGQEIILKGQFAPNAEGHPNIPVVNRYVAVPRGATVSLQYKENASTTLYDVDLLPAMPARTDLAEGPIQLRWDADIFSTDANYPTENIVLSTPTQIRKLDVVMLSITPFRYNPVKRTLEVIYDIDIDLRFEGGNGQFGDSRYFSPEWKHILQNLVVNGEMLSSANYYDLINDAYNRDVEGAEYLIITPNTTTALAWADTLKAFRTKQGILTKVVTTTECGGNTDNAIRNYIVNAYNTWDIPPAAVLLFGGWYNNSGVRPFYHTTVQGDYNPQRYATDYPYCDMNGDSIADLALSRVTARTAQEYKTFVQKTIEYESHPYTDPGYYDHPIVTTGYEANKWFLIHTQALNGFYRNKLNKHPTNLYMVHSGSIPDTAWSTGFNTEVVVNYFGSNGQNYIPDDPSELHDWMSKSDSVPLINALNEGAFMTVYRGHSNFNAWWFPAFKYYTLDNVVNAPNTYVISVSCSCGIFTNAGRGMVEAFCLKEDGGGVGGIGANALTHSQFNDILGWGIYDCMWPEFLPDMGSSIAPEFIRPAFILAEAKNYLDYYFFLPNWWPGRGASTKHIFGCTGETYLNLFTETPQPIQIDYGLFLPSGTHEYTVTAEEGAVVCLSKDDQIIGVATSQGQPLTFYMPDLAEGEQFTLTATKQNRIRHEAQIGIVTDNGPFVAVERDGMLVENEYGILHYGENANVGIVIHNFGNDGAASITMRLSSPSPYIEVTQDMCNYNNLASNETATINEAFSFNVADDIPDMTEVPFIVTITDENGARDCPLKMPVAAPSLVIKPEITFTDENQKSILQIAHEGITDVHVQITNDGHFKSDPFNLQLEIKAPFIIVDNPSPMFNALETGNTDEVVFRINAHDSPVEDAWIQTNILLNDGIHQGVLDTVLPYGGFNENFDLEHFNVYDWQMSGDAPWAVTDEVYHSEDYSAKSGVITHDESSSMSITRTTPATNISFYRKVSSEAGYDKLHFYIDDNDMGEWSGLLPWNYERYIVPAGTHTFTWSYIKDYSVNTGSDCAWIDDVNIEPRHSCIAYSGGILTACKDENVHIDCSYAYEYFSLEWATEGDGEFDDAHALHPVYIPGPQDNANGGTTLLLTANGNPSPLQLILTDEISLGNEIVGDHFIDPNETNISHYSIEGQEGINYIWQLEPAEAGYIFAHDNAADIVWSFRDNITEATLTVTADAGCSQTLSKTIKIDILDVAEQFASCFTLFPNPTDGKVNLILGQDLQGQSVVEVYNVLGSLMTSKFFCNLTEGQSIALDLQHYAPGIYIIKLCNDEGCWSKKVSVR